MIDEESNPPVQDSAKTIVSFLLANSFIKTLGRVSLSSPKINFENSFFNFSLIGLIIFFASRSFLARAVILSLTSPKFAYGATVGFLRFNRSLIFSAPLDSPMRANLRVF